MESEEKTRWDTKYRESPHSWTEPDDFLKRANEEFLSDVSPGCALDLAGGAGRNSSFLVERGWRVRLLDISDVGLELAKGKMTTPPHFPGKLETERIDLNTVTNLGRTQFDLIMVFYFLRRELFPAIAAALKPGGWLIYRTYTIDRMKVPGGPDDPRYLLQANELLRAFPDLRVMHYHETITGKAAAELVARKSQ
jgi:SAM-dependent methyltransferase